MDGRVPVSGPCGGLFRRGLYIGAYKASVPGQQNTALEADYFGGGGTAAFDCRFYAAVHEYNG